MPQHALHPDAGPPFERINITDQVWAKIELGVIRVASEILRRFPSGAIRRINVNACSLTRHTMIPGSDLDEMYIGVEDVPEEALDALTHVFISSSDFEDLDFSGPAQRPIVVSDAFLRQREAEFKSAGKNILTIYQDGHFEPRDVLFRASRLRFGQLDKQFARFKLLIAMNEMTLDSALDLLQWYEPVTPAMLNSSTKFEKKSSLVPATP